MRIIKSGHRFALNNLKEPGETILQFYQDAEIHGSHVSGPSTQEVLRACISRVQHLDSEKPWRGNRLIVRLLRYAIVLFEQRALERVVEKDFAIESLETYQNGHLFDI